MSFYMLNATRVEKLPGYRNLRGSLFSVAVQFGALGAWRHTGEVRAKGGDTRKRRERRRAPFVEYASFEKRPHSCNRMQSIIPGGPRRGRTTRRVHLDYQAEAIRGGSRSGDQRLVEVAAEEVGWEGPNRRRYRDGRHIRFVEMLCPGCIIVPGSYQEVQG
jgi:hypothetical protein